MKKIYDLTNNTCKDIEYTPEEIEEMRIETETIEKLQEIAELKNWFNSEYRTENEKATRLQALSITYSHYDEYRDKTYNSLNDLYLEAEIVRARINQLESELM